MKTKSLINALNKILSQTKTIEGNVAYIVGDKRIVVIDQGGNAIAFPMIGTKVVHNGNYTIKNLISFITNDMNEDQISYLKTIKSMYAKVSNERRLEMVKEMMPSRPETYFSETLNKRVTIPDGE